jgi:hypothetical protein
MNLYATAPGGASGTEVLYATGITLTTFNMSVTAPVSTHVPPATNQSGGKTIRALDVVGNVLGTVDPSWGGYQGSV